MIEGRRRGRDLCLGIFLFLSIVRIHFCMSRLGWVVIGFVVYTFEN